MLVYQRVPCADPTAPPPSPALHFPLHGRSHKATNLDSLSLSFKTIVTLQLQEILVLQLAFTMFWQTKRWSAFLAIYWVAQIVLFAVKSATTLVTLVLMNSGSVTSMCPVMHLDAFCRSPQHQRAVVSSQTIYWSLRCISSPALECDTAVHLQWLQWCDETPEWTSTCEWFVMFIVVKSCVPWFCSTCPRQGKRTSGNPFLVTAVAGAADVRCRPRALTSARVRPWGCG